MHPRVELSRMYSYVRARQLEGTYPGDPATGTWVVSAMRIGRGWGTPLETDWPYNGRAEDWPPVEPPDMDQKARPHRTLAYRRARNLDEARHIVGTEEMPVLAAFEIASADWYRAVDGVIPFPASTSLDASHAVLIVGYDDNSRLLKIMNSWGEEWGVRGYGSLPYEYFDQYVVDAWVLQGPFGQRLSPERAGAITLVKRTVDCGGPLHVFDMYDPAQDDRIGWALARRFERHLDVEDLFVAPAFRMRGHGRTLRDELVGFAAREGVPLRFWISHADADDANLATIRNLLGPRGFELVASSERWASYVTRHGIGDGAPRVTSHRAAARRPANVMWRR